jgi:hypothetical protein
MSDETVPILRRLRSWLKPRHGVLVVSNDAASNPDGVDPADGV